MKRTEMITFKFFIQIDKVWPAGHSLLALIARH